MAVTLVFVSFLVILFVLAALMMMLNDFEKKMDHFLKVIKYRYESKEYLKSREHAEAQK